MKGNLTVWASTHLHHQCDLCDKAMQGGIAISNRLTDRYIQVCPECAVDIGMQGAKITKERE